MSQRILLVDDEPCSVYVIELNLRREGYEVISVIDGEEAWKAIEHEKPDLIIADYQMPRLNGLELAARVRGCAATADIPIIMFTAKGFELSADDIRQEFGILAMIPKPFHPRSFLRLTEGILGPHNRATA